VKKKGKKKRKAKSTPPPDIASGVDRALREIAESEDKGEAFEESLGKIRSHLGTSAEKDAAIVNALGGLATSRAAWLLKTLAQSVSDKRILKIIKRSLYRIKQQGISVEPDKPEHKLRSVLHPRPREEVRGFMSAVDAEGNQLVLLTVPRKLTGLYLLQGIVNDARGLVEFHRVETTKRGFREFYQSIRESGEFPVVDVDPGHCRFLLEQAAETNTATGQALPPGYVASTRDLEELKKPEVAPIYHALDERSIEEDPKFLQRSPELFEIDPFSSWILPQDEVQRYAELVQEAEESRLVLNPAQKETRLQEVYRKALAELFPEERRKRYKRRLEETAYVLLKNGQEDSARLALAASLDLRSGILDLKPNPFLLNLVIRSIYTLVIKDTEERREDEPSLIVKP
jgi:hypothetical protein